MKIIANKGCYPYPENTLISFKAALQSGAHGINVDVRVSEDGVLVAMDDETIDRTTNGTGNIADKRIRELRSYDAGNNQCIPAIEEVLRLVAKFTRDTGKRPFILFQLQTRMVAVKLCTLIEKYIDSGYLSYEQIIITSSFIDQLERTKRCNDNINMAAILKKRVKASDVAEIAEFSPYAMIIPVDSVNNELIMMARKKARHVFAYYDIAEPLVENNIKRIKSLINVNLSALITLYPKEIINAQDNSDFFLSNKDNIVDNLDKYSKSKDAINEALSGNVKNKWTDYIDA